MASWEIIATIPVFLPGDQPSSPFDCNFRCVVGASASDKQNAQELGFEKALETYQGLGYEIMAGFTYEDMQADILDLDEE